MIIACGNLTPIDQRHKLTSFIAKNPEHLPTIYDSASRKSTISKNRKMRVNPVGEQTGAKEAGSDKGRGM
jgi:hypothetical protein